MLRRAQSEKTLPQEQNPTPTSGGGGSPADSEGDSRQVLRYSPHGGGGARPPGRGGQAHPAVPACARSAVRVHVLVCQGHSGMFV